MKFGLRNGALDGLLKMVLIVQAPAGAVVDLEASSLPLPPICRPFCSPSRPQISFPSVGFQGAEL